MPVSVTDPLKIYANNTGANRALLSAAVASGVCQFIFSSTVPTYGISEVVPVTEEAPQRSNNPYGTSKLMTEAVLAEVAAAHPLNYCALRYFNVAGADPHGRFGQSTASATHLIKVLVAVTGERDGPAVDGTDYVTADGTRLRDDIHVSDLASAHVLALEALIATPLRAVPGSTAATAGLFGVRGVPRGSIVPRRPGDPDALVADNGCTLGRRCRGGRASAIST